MVLTSVARRIRTWPPNPVVALPICNRSVGQFAKYSNEFLNIGAGARGMSMGNAQVASVLMELPVIGILQHWLM